jgi:ubiquinone/menaquinone biosynthesis C-methylase UbiE
MSLIDTLSENPRTFHFLRKIPECNYQQTKKKIRSYFDRRVPTLDLGCGTAEFCRCFAPESYLGIDISEKYIAYAKKRCPEYSFIVASGENLCVRTKSFPQVLINGVIHHLHDDLAGHLLNEAHRILRDDGRLLLIEDIDTRSVGLVGRLIHAMDMGDYIRRPGDYQGLISKLFAIEESFTYHSGYCHYGLWLLKKKI